MISQPATEPGTFTCRHCGSRHPSTETATCRCGTGRPHLACAASEYSSPQDWKVGDVIQDSYGNPAVIFRIENGKPYTICQTTGSDRGRLTSPPLHLVRVTRPEFVQNAKAVGRETWRALGYGRNTR